MIIVSLIVFASATFVFRSISLSSHDRSFLFMEISTERKEIQKRKNGRNAKEKKRKEKKRGEKKKRKEMTNGITLETKRIINTD